MGTVGLLMVFFLRIFVAQGWYIGTLYVPLSVPTRGLLIMDL
jgi:hypothetical protein